MAEPDPKPSRANGGSAGLMAGVTKQVIGALPPTLLWLLIINALFMVGVLWFVSNETGQRAAIINRIIDGCSTALLHAQPQGTTR